MSCLPDSCYEQACYLFQLMLNQIPIVNSPFQRTALKKCPIENEFVRIEHVSPNVQQQLVLNRSPQGNSSHQVDV